MKSQKGLLHHVEIYVPDLQVCISFWGWLLQKLGYQEYQRWDAGISYILADTYIVFVQTEERFQNPPYHRCHNGLNHLAFHGGTIEFIDEMKNELISRGVTILYPESYPHAGGEDGYALFFEDPQRMKVEISL